MDVMTDTKSNDGESAGLAKPGTTMNDNPSSFGATASLASSAAVVDTTATGHNYGEKDFDDITESTATETISTSFSGRTLLESPPWENTRKIVVEMDTSPIVHNVNVPKSPRPSQHLHAFREKFDDQSAHCATQPHANSTATQLQAFREKFGDERAFTTHQHVLPAKQLQHVSRNVFREDQEDAPSGNFRQQSRVYCHVARLSPILSKQV